MDDHKKGLPHFTREKLEELAKQNYKYIKEISVQYLENDIEYYNLHFIPVLDKYKHLDIKNRKECNNISSNKEINKAVDEIISPFDNVTDNNIYYCSQCGAKIFASAVYCYKCGEEINIPTQGSKNENLNSKPIKKYKEDWISMGINSSDEDVTYEYRDINGRPMKDWQDKTEQNNWWIPIGFLSAIISLFIFPPAFGIFGVVCGIMAIIKHNPGWGGFIILFSLICMMIGIIFGAMVLTSKFLN